MFGDNLKRLRKEKKYTQSQLGDKVGVSGAYIQQLESSTKNNPSLEVLMKIAKALDVQVTDLDPNIPVWEEFDVTYDTKKLAKEVQILEALSDASTQELIDELMKRDDFEIKLLIKNKR